MDNFQKQNHPQILKRERVFVLLGHLETQCCLPKTETGFKLVSLRQAIKNNIWSWP